MRHMTHIHAYYKHLGLKICATGNKNKVEDVFNIRNIKVIKL